MRLFTLALMIALIRVSASLLNEKKLVAREHSVLIFVQSVVRISQLIHSLAIAYGLVRYVREGGFVATLGDALNGIDLVAPVRHVALLKLLLDDDPTFPDCLPSA